eukprot:CAMPEP_0198722860 /NCGR_PEP_ID=MMETSP1475-20131203/456_1 /TAXON_ID= ORGANISM="Unidentified sp., Strain CCMP1999" /NCGR_SAMPLE_ID=MMETSP1475 /ASSEMBLY_ACC=CAM_ASM_001111 /LENGTH=255 /DNA_ID=CAMNT_0044483789 /DNA_START=31 /DNA_END=798 /DNA_ORIENTATION=+
MASFVPALSGKTTAARRRVVCSASVPSRRDFLKICSGCAAAWLVPLGVAQAGDEVDDKAGLKSTKKAIFAGGCFWCMEKPFDLVPGVVSTTPGYCGGNEKNPTYRQVGSGKTGHAESIEVEYDPSQVSYSQLLDVFWHQVDPTTPNRQFCDKGKQYRTAIFYADEEQKKAAMESRDKYEASGIFPGKIITEITPLKKFWPAEEYHWDYYQKNPQLYAFYRANCGRDRFLESIWGSSGSSFSITDIPAAIQQRLGL